MKHVFALRRSLDFRTKIYLCLIFLFALCCGALAQDGNELSVDDEISNEITPTQSTPVESTPIPSTPFTGEPPAFGRTIVLVLGGVSWRDLAALSAPTSTSTPALRRILEEGALGAAWLPGQADAAQREYSLQGPNEENVSSAMLRAAAILSSGAPLPRGVLPQTLSQTLGLDELLSRDAAGFESSPAALAFARRTGRAPQSGNLLNLGWGAASRQLIDEARDASAEQEQVLPLQPLGALGAAVHRAGGKTFAIGNGETSVEILRGARLREAALVGADAVGIVDGGDVSLSTLARDKDAPFGVRTNSKATLQALDLALADPLAALVSIEWGDTRRAQRYAAFCAPDIALAHRQTALRRLDAFAGKVLNRLSKNNDRLILLVVPDLDSSHPQLLPLAFWRPQRGGQGALLTSAQSETFGLIGLENVHSKIVVAQLGEKNGAEFLARPLEEIGVPQPPIIRIGKLLALESGLSWLARARPLAHAAWCALFILAAALSLLAFNTPSERLKASARFLWCATMIFPWLLWLAGLCVETTWRFGGGENWKLWLALLLVACLMWFLLGATFNWFSRTKLLSTRIAIAWLLLTIVAVWIGAFALPFNALLHLHAQQGSTPFTRVGDVWALLLISATLLGLAALTRAPANFADAPHPPREEESAIEESSVEESSAQVRRAINVRPALLWAIAIIAILAVARWGNNFPAAVVAFIGLGALCLRLWFERAPREMRLTGRRIVIGFLIGAMVLLLWQRGGAPLVSSTLSAWWPQWLASWSEVWWSAAFVSTLILVLGSSLPRPRQTLRAYLLPRFSTRAMLGAGALAAVFGVLLLGPSAAPLLATFTLGAVVYESLR